MKEKMTDFDALLSPLEQDILQVLWQKKSMRVREIYNKLKDKRKLALSSVAVLLDRLYERNIVDREIETARGGVRYVYFAKQDKIGFEKSVVEQTVNKLIDAFGKVATAYFDERFRK